MTTDPAIQKDPQCPVCGVKVNTAATSIVQFVNGRFIAFDTMSCAKAYRANPEKYAQT